MPEPDREEGKEEGFEVKDRRRVYDDTDDTPASEATANDSNAGDRPAGADSAARPAGDEGEYVSAPELDFIAFLGSMAATAYMHLGERIAPDQPETGVNLPAAKQMIDLLDMIKLKTAGNLTADEQGAMDAILYNLRMRFISETKKGRN